MARRDDGIEIAELRCTGCDRLVDDLGDDVGGVRFGHADGSELCAAGVVVAVSA